MIKIMEDVTVPKDDLLADKVNEVIYHLNAIQIIVQEYPECKDIICQLNECKRRIKKFSRK